MLEMGKKMDLYKKELEKDVLKKIEKLKSDGWNNEFDNSDKK
jgi:hypothetical protein